MTKDLNMKHFSRWAVAPLLLLTLCCCGKKQKSSIIILDKPVETKPAGPIAVGDFDQTYDEVWDGKTYHVTIVRKADESLPQAKEDNQPFFDNRVTLRINRADGTLLYENTFQKSDFNAYLSDSQRQNSLLLTIMPDPAEGNGLRFIATVGLPEMSSDELVPVSLRISADGQLSMGKAPKLETEENPAALEEEGV